MSEQDREQWGGGRSEGGRSEGGRREGGRRSGDQRDSGGGGFRIRLSDNELQAARTLQEAFQLRSTVAVLGFSLRTMAQLLEQGLLLEAEALDEEFRGLGQADQLLTMPTGLS